MGQAVEVNLRQSFDTPPMAVSVTGPNVAER
jgi:hypothetical protein